MYSILQIMQQFKTVLCSKDDCLVRIKNKMTQYEMYFGYCNSNGKKNVISGNNVHIQKQH